MYFFWRIPQPITLTLEREVRPKNVDNNLNAKISEQHNKAPWSLQFETYVFHVMANLPTIGEQRPYSRENAGKYFLSPWEQATSQHSEEMLNTFTFIDTHRIHAWYF